MTLSGCSAFLCKWSNEGCDRNDECCSGSCQQLHPGMNARCTKSVLHNPCIFTHHCQDRLHCGADNTCCSKYWGTCRRQIDCCNKNYICIDVKGFHYRRCLPAPVDGVGIKQNVTAILTMFSTFFILFLNQF
ncbi:hypothetical protein SNE40_000707 [Patella caerulea]|uniref:Uncharacterized protein n=1 Tax=Patella caerulea TaxID=87958 RepID=A0AAN8Q1X4_PATCE